MIHPSLTWVHPCSTEEDSHQVGLTSFAAKELGEIVFVQLPPPNTFVEAGELLAIVESTKTATDIYSPLSGTVTEQNTKLLTHPQLLSLSPEKEGWLVNIRRFSCDECSCDAYNLLPKSKTATLQLCTTL